MTKSIQFQFKIGRALADAAGVVLSDPAGAYGIRRTDTLAIIAAAGTPLLHVSTGIYQYQFAEPAAGLTYQYSVEWMYAGATYHEVQFLETAPAPGLPGTIAPPPSQFVRNGVETVSCDDAPLAEFLNAQAPMLWALQARRGVTLDLRYQYFVLDLLTLAQDHVRMLIDTEIGDAQMASESYNNQVNSSDLSSSFHRTGASAFTEAASSLQTFTRTAFRTTSMTSSEGANRDSSRSASGSDTSLTVQHSSGVSSRISTAHSQVLGTGDGNSHQHHNSSAGSGVSLTTTGNFTRLQISAPTIGTVGGQVGQQDNNGSATQILGANGSGTGVLNHSRTIAATSTTAGSSTLTTTGSRQQNVSRASHYALSGSSFATSSSTLSSGSHSEQHRSASSSFHSTSSSHGVMAANSLAHREGAGASSMVSSSAMDREYYSQIFESLQQMWEDCKKEIERLEQQVMMPARYLVQKLTTTTPQARIVGPCAAQMDKFIIQRPGRPGAPFMGGFNRFIVH